MRNKLKKRISKISNYRELAYLLLIKQIMQIKQTTQIEQLQGAADHTNRTGVTIKNKRIDIAKIFLIECK